jgi:hypothetical protein
MGTSSFALCVRMAAVGKARLERVSDLAPSGRALNRRPCSPFVPTVAEVVRASTVHVANHSEVGCLNGDHMGSNSAIGDHPGWMRRP